MPGQHTPIVVPADPREWRPQTIRRTKVTPEILDPLGEPLWSGIRVIVHYRGSDVEGEWGTIEVLDAYGDDALDAAPTALDLLRRSIRATEAVIDGVITTQATTGGEGPSHQQGTPGFVALDVLSIDDQPLFDVPLLERKRLLEGAIEPGDLVRVSPVVRPPLRQWFASWQSAGFKGLVIKAANSRYQPGGESIEWATVLRMPSN